MSSQPSHIMLLWSCRNLFESNEVHCKIHFILHLHPECVIIHITILHYFSRSRHIETPKINQTLFAAQCSLCHYIWQIWHDIYTVNSSNVTIKKHYNIYYIHSMFANDSIKFKSLHMAHNSELSWGSSLHCIASKFKQLIDSDVQLLPSKIKWFQTADMFWLWS